MATVRFFAAAKAATKTPEIQLAGNTVGELLAAAKEQFVNLAAVLTKCSLLLNEVACSDLNTPTNDEDILDVLPPFAGG